MTKNTILDPILTYSTEIWTAKFFFKNLAPSVTRYPGQLSSCALSEKTNDSILRKFSDERTDRRVRVISKDVD